MTGLHLVNMTIRAHVDPQTFLSETRQECWKPDKTAGRARLSVGTSDAIQNNAVVGTQLAGSKLTAPQ